MTSIGGHEDRFQSLTWFPWGSLETGLLSKRCLPFTTAHSKKKTYSLTSLPWLTFLFFSFILLLSSPFSLMVSFPVSAFRPIRYVTLNESLDLLKPQYAHQQNEVFIYIINILSILRLNMSASALCLPPRNASNLFISEMLSVVSACTRSWLICWQEDPHLPKRWYKIPKSDWSQRPMGWVLWIETWSTGF